ncbi:MAG: ATP-binding protein [Polyangiaceae bacterium]|nr:ATP-binding protein [Polyangiaceae bacterium]
MPSTDLKITQSSGPAAARLVMVEGPHVGERFNLSASIIIGRSTLADICVEDVGVSRKHAQVKRTDDGVYVISDLQSKNGVYVNEKKVEELALAPGDKIRLGPRATFVFGYLDPVEEQLRQKQRLETLGRALAGIAHDLNNVVGALSANTDFLARMNPSATFEGAEVTAALEDMKLAAVQARNLTRSVVNFARGKAASFGLVDMSELCLETIRLARHALGRSVTVETDIAPKLVVRGSQSELQQALMNLLVNARDAMPEGGHLKVSVKSLKGKDCPKVLDLTAGDSYVVLEVADSGAGVPPEILPYIFQPFFTTKGHGSGAGIGLATVKDVVGLHKGRVDVQSKMGLGTTFRIYVPRLEIEAPVRSGSTGKMPAVALPGTNPNLGKLILVVDDDPLVRRAVSRVLVREQYEIAEAESGKKAIERYLQYPQPVLVLMDLDMPGMSGEETYRELLKIDPGVLVVLCSGRVDLDPSARAGAMGAAATLQKPFSGDTLRATLATLLAQTSALDDEVTKAHGDLSKFR